MNEKINSDFKSFKFIFNKNRSYVLPVIVILVSVIIFFRLVIPQFGVLITVRKEAKEASLKLEILKGNLNILTNVNEEVLDSQLQILKSALPLNKDFIGILNSIYSTAQKTGVDLGGFSFKIGDLARPEDNDNFPVVRLALPINSSVVGINSFVGTISKTVPLSEVYSVKVGNASSNIGISFYYKPLGGSTYSQDVRISPVSQRGLTIVSQLSEFGGMRLQ